MEQPRPAAHRLGEEPDELVEAQHVRPGGVEVQVDPRPAAMAIRATSSTCTG